MARKVRGARSTHRPGGQGPSRSKKTSDASASADTDASGATTDVDIDAAVDSYEPVEAEYTEITLEDPAPAAAATTAAAEPRRRRTRRRNKAKADDLVSRAAAEDVWVREDLRRIGVVSVILLVTLAVCWVVFYWLDVLSLY